MWPHGHYINNIFSISFRYVFAFVIYSVAGKLYNAHDAFVRIAFTAHNLIVWCAHIFECDVHSQAAMLAEMHKTHLVSANYNILIASNESAFMSFPVGVCVFWTEFSRSYTFYTHLHEGFISQKMFDFYMTLK